MTSTETHRRVLLNVGLLQERALIAGRWLDGKDWLQVDNPATGEILGVVPSLGRTETEAAIEAAAAAFSQWRRVPAGERASLLERWFALITEASENLAMLLTLEQGKPLADARNEVAYGASFVKWFAEEARRVEGSIIPSTPDRRILALREPIGVCAIITPWNLPNSLLTRKVAAALAAGCTVVIKPSELTPYSALALGFLAEKAGLPAGVVNIVTGLPEEIGAELCANPTVRKLSFTGSTRVGSLLMAQCAPTVKRLSLELGGNAPFIIFDDADLDAAVQGLVQSKFRNTGQSCIAANRVLVHASVHDAFVERLATAVSALKVGNGLEPGVDMGPLINNDAVGKFERHVADAIERGARIVARAEAPSGRFAAPTVIADATTAMSLAKEETFGPVAPLFRFETEAEAVAIANATPFGLAAYFYTQDLSRAWRMGEALEFGMVGLNTGVVSATTSPFGGVKQSGLGREGARIGIDEYLEVKAFHMGGLTGHPVNTPK